MVLFDNTALLDFPRYGITIPALDSRKIQTLKALCSHPDLAGKEPSWLIDRFTDSFTLEDLCRAHSRDYAAGFFDERAAERLRVAYELLRPDGSYNRWAPNTAESPLEDMVGRLMRNMAGSYRAARVALKTGFCHYLGGGAHHGHRAFSHGFCPVNDTAVAIRRLQAEKRIVRAWVIDLDAHKGDGTAAIFHDDNRVITLSIHMAQGWPLDGSLPADHPSHTPSDIDVPIASGEEPVYLERLEKALAGMKEKGSADVAVVLAGSDPWEADQLPSTRLLNLTMDELGERDRMVYCFLENCGLPSVWLTSGGYGDESWRIHYNFLQWALTRRTAARSTPPGGAESTL